MGAKKTSEELVRTHADNLDMLLSNEGVINALEKGDKKSKAISRLLLKKEAKLLLDGLKNLEGNLNLATKGYELLNTAYEKTTVKTVPYLYCKAEQRYVYDGKKHKIYETGLCQKCEIDVY